MSINHQIKAILGPTNTGKTHLALERMLAYPSGIIGFPLRLLARENYDRMVAIKGEKNVGLITGEEKICPPQAKWFSCTVEAMPVHLPTDIVVIDEIQLCADPDRGHIFTDRLLHCRGKYETIFLGSDTITAIIKKLIPNIEIETRPRLSALTYNGFTKITKLPPRCAIVTFSIHEVYAIAELIKRQKGGCAIIMGRLSPRTRNAQMELYQNKEVDYLIATDAIGMGLNMDVNHIAFVSLSKYDGHQMRDLYPSEIAQIAGRAGRGNQDGTFGTTANCPKMNDKIIHNIENHLFDPLKRIYWRNHHLDFKNPLALFASLTKSSTKPYLITSQYASDLLTLSYLIQDKEIISVCNNYNKTQILWECCQIPDFRKLGGEYHARICKQTFLFLLKKHHIPEAWINQQIQQLNHTHGDIDTLMQRLANIRICSYLTTKNDWVDSAPYWQAQTKEIEEQLSDSLHHRLITKFVNQRGNGLIRHLSRQKQIDLFVSISTSGEILIEGENVGHLKGLTFQILDTIPADDHPFILKNIHRKLVNFIPQQIQKIISTPNKDFQLDFNNKMVLWKEIPIARIKRGIDFFHPEILILEKELITPVLHHALTQRLKCYVEHQCQKCFPNFFRLLNKKDNPPIIRGILYQLYENGGILWNIDQLSLPKDSRKILSHHKIHCGKHAIYIEDIFKIKKYNLRLFFLALFENIDNLPVLSPQNISHPMPTNVSPIVLQKMGWLTAGTQLIRLDIAEKLTSTLQNKSKQFPISFQKHHIIPLPYKKNNLSKLLQALKLYVQQPQKLSNTLTGPPAPLLISKFPFRKRRKAKIKIHRTTSQHNQFAMLKNLYS